MNASPHCGQSCTWQGTTLENPAETMTALPRCGLSLSLDDDLSIVADLALFFFVDGNIESLES